MKGNSVVNCVTIQFIFWIATFWLVLSEKINKVRVFTGGLLESILVSMNKNLQSRNNPLWIKRITRMLVFTTLIYWEGLIMILFQWVKVPEKYLLSLNEHAH